MSAAPAVTCCESPPVPGRLTPADAAAPSMTPAPLWNRCTVYVTRAYVTSADALLGPG